MASRRPVRAVVSERRSSVTGRGPGILDIEREATGIPLVAHPDQGGRLDVANPRT
jgi:hypothetical protein